VVKVNTYLNDVTRFAEYDAIYREFFPAEPPRGRRSGVS